MDVDILGFISSFLLLLRSVGILAEVDDDDGPSSMLLLLSDETFISIKAAKVIAVIVGVILILSS